MAHSAGEGSSKDAPAPPKKRSLFGNPSWSKPEESQDGIDFFSRAKELYPMRIAEEERKLQKKLARQKQERKRSGASVERKASITPDVKRQRLSSETQEDKIDSSDDSPTKQVLDDVFSSHEKSQYGTPPTNYKTRTRSPGSPTILSVRNGRTSRNKKTESPERDFVPSNIISLSDSDDSKSQKRVTRSTRSAAQQLINVDDDDDGDIIYPSQSIIPPAEEEELELSDEEFPELVQRAREREKQKELERLSAAKVSGHKPFVNESTPLGTGGVFQDSSASGSDPVVEILVTSRMEDTVPLLVKRRLNQRLKEVRLSWCDKQQMNGAPLPVQFKAALFLTWNGKRLFDASTCKHLGIRMGQDGRFASDRGGFDDNGRLHFEAWTEDLFMAFQNGTLVQQRAEEAHQEEVQQTQEPAGKVRLLLKAKDMEPFRLRVKPSTTVRKMCEAFRLEKNIPEEKDIALYFDGDRLDADLTVEGSEMEDMDTLEVHVR